ncbi:DUF58 domain-containing protein [Crateriforma conspicua]|uniref:DUF58 domain-containing protein n=1 Tax=Crateriforma conspicua TaxID=2527996 RepID=A0A5C5Y2J4_9PLAN|nr:DUF58 domain-containing protein [Crateriforma conspicua]TWT68883.1 hypothetical protein Pan14r_11660 [Crateriforma conspicua]
MRGHWIDWLAGIAALVLLGWLFGASLWLLAAVVVGLLLAINQYLARLWSHATTAVRHGGDLEVAVGSNVPIELAVTNRSKVPVGWVLVEDLLPRWAMRGSELGLDVDGDRIAVMMLPPGKTTSMHYTIRVKRRGYFQVGPTVLETGDFLGLFRRYRVGTQPQYITVLPRVVPLSGYDIASRRPIGEIRMRDNVMDDPTRLRGIRQWQPGDPMRSVHWAATARTGTLHSKIYEPSSIAGATLVLDFHRRTNPVKHEPVRGDLAVTAAASISAMLHDQNEPFGLISNGRDAADRIRHDGWRGDHRVRDSATRAGQMLAESDRMRPVIMKPDRGVIQFKDVMRRLARLEPTDGLTLPELLAECEGRLSNETTVLVILQQCDEATASALIGLSRRGWEVAVIVNTHDINDYSAIAGPMIAARIATFHLADFDSVADVCRNVAIR